MGSPSPLQPYRSRFLRIFLARFDHPWVTLGIYLPAGILLIAWSQHLEAQTWPKVLLWIVSGIFAWTLIEYLLHRFVFHWTQGREPWRSIASGLHLAHHRDVEAKDLILAPPFLGFLLGPIEVALFSLLTGSLARALLVEVGLFLGYLAYEWVHFSVHFRPARHSLAQFWKAKHLAHHFKDPSRNFGVTSSLWDWVFRT